MSTIQQLRKSKTEDTWELIWDVKVEKPLSKAKIVSHDEFSLDTFNGEGAEMQRLGNIVVSVSVSLQPVQGGRDFCLCPSISLKWNGTVVSNTTANLDLELLGADSVVGWVKELGCRKLSDFPETSDGSASMDIPKFYIPSCNTKDYKYYFSDSVFRFRLKLRFTEEAYTEDSEDIQLNEKGKLEDNAVNNLLTALGNLQAMKGTADMKIVCGSESFPVHKVMLAVRSPVFARMIATDMKESQTNEVKVEDIEPDVLSTLLDFIYAARLPADDSNVDKLCGIAVAADKYEVLELKNYCLKDLLRKLNCKNFRQIAMTFHIVPHEKKQQKIIWYFCSRNWPKLQRDTELVKLARDYPDAFFPPAPAEEREK